MDLDQSPLGKVPDLTGLRRKGCPGPCRAPVLAMEVPGNPSPRRCGGRSGSVGRRRLPGDQPIRTGPEGLAHSPLQRRCEDVSADDYVRPAARRDGRHAGPFVGVGVPRGWRCCSARTRHRCAAWRIRPLRPWPSARARSRPRSQREASPAAPDVTRSFQVQAPTAPTITFDQPRRCDGRHAGRPDGVARPRRACRCCSDSDTPSVCTVTGSTVTTVAVGTCTITAYQHVERARWPPT